MKVQIDAAAGLIFLTSCVVGYLVYRHSLRPSGGVPQHGDLAAAFTAGAATLAGLAFLFSVGGGTTTGQTDGPTPPSPTATAPTMPGPSEQSSESPSAVALVPQ